jgi:hypothetical protein
VYTVQTASDVKTQECTYYFCSTQITRKQVTAAMSPFID